RRFYRRVCLFVRHSSPIGLHEWLELRSCVLMITGGSVILGKVVSTIPEHMTCTPAKQNLPFRLVVLALLSDKTCPFIAQKGRFWNAFPTKPSNS
ncbi:MAG: hypothetical protein PUK16_03930, partial [Prevotellaceae bacterium]|nr:hypothetical protein [Prevotellaceae bacterium]